jgi:hypothetical protein
MFKAIRNLVRQRSRDGHQGQPEVIEEDANAGQRAFVGIAEGQRGPEAASIRVA